MTFIGIACKGDHAEIAFDEGSYSEHAVKFRRTTKVTHFHHLDALMTASGNPQFTWPAQRIAWSATLQNASFDELVSEAPVWLGQAAREANIDPDALSAAEAMSGTVYLVGWSDLAQEFEAWLFTPDNLKGEKAVGMVVRPVPFSLRPPVRDLKRIVKGLRRAGAPTDLVEGLWSQWGSRPLPQMPKTDAEWVALAELARAERSLQGPELRTFVTGALRLTTLHRDISETRTLRRFDDDDPTTLRTLLDGSLHPIAQVLPCGCREGNTKRPVECCFVDLRDAPCMCGSERRFRECCEVTDPADVDPTQLWTSPFAW